MKKKYITTILLIIAMTACDNEPDHTHAQLSAGDSMQTNHASGMHHEHMEGMPQVQTDHSDMIHLSPREILLAGIKTDSVRMNNFEESVTALGIVTIDESTLSVLTARTAGRIDRLYTRNPGADVAKGQPVVDIYSETLLADQMELIQLLSNNALPELISAAKQRLQLHGLTEKQIAEIEKSRVASPHVTVYSNASGFLSSVSVREGQYITTGDVLCEIASLDVVRVNAQVYTQEIGAFINAVSYKIESGFGTDSVRKTALLINNPSMEQGSKLFNAWLRVSNNDHSLRPGMMVTVRAVSGAAQLLTIPKSSLLAEDGMQFTWVENEDGMFSRRMVQTGKSNSEEVEVTRGLQEGDRIVTSGIYLLNSEYILKKGGGSMAGMEM